MKIKKQIEFFFFGLLFVLCNCSQQQNIERANKILKDSIVVKKNDSLVLTLEDKIMDAVMSLPEVKKANAYIDSISNHKKGIAGIMSEPEKGETDYGVRVGYNGEERFEVYYFFYVDPKNFQIKILNIITDSVISVEEWRKLKSSEN